MSLSRTLRPFLNLRAVASPASRTPSLTASRRYATDTAKTSADGASDKTIENAEPKILKRSPPKEGEEGEGVREHNEDMANRADKVNGKDSKEDVEKDKVSKEFWNGKGEAGA